MKQKLLFLAISLALVLFLTSCTGVTTTADEELYYFYNGKAYTDLNKSGGLIQSEGHPLEEASEKAKVYLGFEKDENEKPKDDILLFKDKSLSMFIMGDGYLNVDTSYTLPDYMKDSAEEIIILPEDSVEYTSKNKVSITDKKQIDVLLNEMRKASDKSNWRKEKDYLTQSDNDILYYIGIKYKGINAVQDFGYLVYNVKNNKYGLRVNRFSTQDERDEIWGLSDEFVKIIEKNNLD